MPIPVAVALGAQAIGGFIKGGGLAGLGGGKARRREEQQAKLDVREAEFNLFNFDYNQDVGPINNPYAGVAQQQEDFLQQNLDASSANQLHLQQQAGNFGAAQAVIGARAAEGRKNARDIQAIRQTGAKYVEDQRQGRIQDKHDQARTLLARAEDRLDKATRARAKAKQALAKGIGAGVTAAVSGGIAGGAFKKGADGKLGSDFDLTKSLKGSGLLPSSAFGDQDLSKYAPKGYTWDNEKQTYVPDADEEEHDN